MAVYHFTQLIVWNNLSGAVRVAAKVRSKTLVDPLTGLVPTLTQGGVSVGYITADSLGRVTFTATVDTVRADFGAGPQLLYSDERLTATSDAAPALAAAATAQAGVNEITTGVPGSLLINPAKISSASRVMDWVTGRSYVVGELAVSGGTAYRCTTAHTSAGGFDNSKFLALVSGSPVATINPGMINPGIYGPGVGFDSKANLQVGPNGQKVAVQFKCSTNSALNSVKFVQRGGTGYSLGTGGTTTVTVQTGDGAGHPSGTILATGTITPGNPAGNWENYSPVTFASPPTLMANIIYYIVFTNPDVGNYISVNSVYSASPTTPRQALVLDSEYSVSYTTGAWGALDQRYLPVIDLAYTNGVHDGQAYFEAMVNAGNYATISGTLAMARELFTVSGGDRTVLSISVRARRTSGTSPLILTLETAAGALIEAVTIPAASIAVSAPDYSGGGGAVWATATFSVPRVLANGYSYSLRLSCASDTTYTTFPIRTGTDKGLLSWVFPDGTGQSTTDGTTWADLYLWSHEDLQFYFTLGTTSSIDGGLL